MESGFERNEIPSLTLEPELEAEPVLAVQEETELAQPQMNEPALTPEEQKIVSDRKSVV